MLKVQVLHPARTKAIAGRLTRLDVLKQMFEALINRILAYNYRTHVGLITVSSKPAVSMGISHVLENLRRATVNMKANGDTALWDSLSLARDQLIEHGRKHPNAKQRVIVISDGLDSTSTSTPQDVCWRLREAGIAVDTVSLGAENNTDLQTISHLLGCFVLQPQSLVNALAICELEPFLSSTGEFRIGSPSPTIYGRS